MKNFKIVDVHLNQYSTYVVTLKHEQETVVRGFGRKWFPVIWHALDNASADDSLKYDEDIMKHVGKWANSVKLRIKIGDELPGEVSEAGIFKLNNQAFDAMYRPFLMTKLENGLHEHKGVIQIPEGQEKIVVETKRQQKKRNDYIRKYRLQKAVKPKTVEVNSKGKQVWIGEAGKKVTNGLVKDTNNPRRKNKKLSAEDKRRQKDYRKPAPPVKKKQKTETVET